MVNPFVISKNGDIQYIKFMAFKYIWKETLNEYDFALLENNMKFR